LRVSEHVFGEHRVGVDDDARMIGVDSGIEKRNQIFRNVIVLTVVAVVTVLLVAREQVVDGQVNVQVGPLQLSDDQGA
jgi:hypothetical protein